MAKQVLWLGSKPTKCQFGGEEITTEFVDGALRKGGVWSILCPDCHKIYGIGVGLGRGQRYVLAEDGKNDGKFVKVEG